LRLLKDRNFGMSNLLMLVFSIGMFGSTFLLPLYLQNSLGYTALQSGAVFLPVGIIQGFMSPLSGWFSDKLNPRIPIMAGVSILAFSLYLNSDLSFLTEHQFIMTTLYLRGLGMGMIFTPLSSFSLATIPHHKMAQASSISNTVRQIGGSLGVALLSTVLTARVNFHAQMYGGAVQSSSQVFQSATRNMAYYIQQHGGGSFTTAMKQGQSLLMGNVSSQAFIQGVDDDFLLAALISLIGFIPIILLKSKKKTQQSHSTTGEKTHLEIIE